LRPYGAAVTRPPRSHLALAAALSVLGLGQAVGTGAGAAWAAAVLVGTAAVVLSATAPLVVAAAALVSTAAQVALADGDPAFASFVVLMAAGYALGRRSDRRTLVPGLVLLVLGVGAVAVGDPTLRTLPQAVPPAVYLGAAVGLGRLVRSRERTAQRAVEAVAAAADSREREALAAERARIAREMHDVVAHSVSLLVVQAESAAAVLDRDPERARAQLERISQTGRESLAELRRVLGLLRPPEGHDATHPQPGLGDLATLGEAVEASGTRVRLVLDDGLEELAPGLQLAAYRVVQEAMTNAVRHGRASSVEVQVRRAAGALDVVVRDNGHATGEGPPGVGLRGMRERVLLYAGELEAGPLEGGGFGVRAVLPVAP
jgi:signal transduction histidine kinase